MDYYIFTLTTAEEDGGTQKAEEIIKGLGDKIEDYQKSKIFPVQNLHISVHILVCTNETWEIILSNLNNVI